jgi:hypothetical protein
VSLTPAKSLSTVIFDIGEQFFDSVFDTGNKFLDFWLFLTDEEFLGGVVDTGDRLRGFLVISDRYQQHRGTVLSPVSLTVVTTEVCTFCKTANHFARTRMPP